jgi:uncharacterized protein (TIGR02246 family)
MKTPKTPAEVDELFGAYVNAANLDGMVAMYEPGATFVAPDGNLRIGHAAIRDELAGFAAASPNIDMGAIRAVRIAEDLAVLHHDWVATLQDADGNVAQVGGKATEVVRKQADGTWRFLLDDPNMRG